MLKGSAKNIGDNLHIMVLVRSEAHSGHHQVVIDYPQAAKSHPVRIIIVCETKGVITVQPPMIGVAPFVGSSNFHHESFCHTNITIEKDRDPCLTITGKHGDGMDR